MRKTLRQKRRWFHAVAITCLSGFALCGCARGTRDLSSNLQKNAEQEAIEAERSIAERKRQDSSSSRILKERDFEEKTASVRRPVKKPVASRPVDDPWSDAEDRERSWSDEQSDSQFGDRENRIQTVSGSETAEDLLSNSDPETSEELFTEPSEPEEPVNDSEEAKSAAEMPSATADDEEGSVRIQRQRTPSPPGDQSRSAYTQSTARSGQASYRGTQEHPWSRKAPVAQRSGQENPAESARTSSRPEMVESRMEETDAQLEAKARVRVLVEQAKSLLRKGEYRSAYRAAQVAQRMAESSNLFFAAGEEQPAEVVRAVLNKIRAEETRVAAVPKSEARSLKPAAKEVESDVTATLQKTTVSKLPDDWTFAEWQGGDKPVATKSAREAVAAKPDGVTGMRIQPSQRRRSDSKAFPGRSDWKSSSDNAADQSTVEQSSASTAENVSSEIVPATLPDDSLTRSPGLKTPRPFPEQEIENTVKAPVPPVEVSSELAVSQSWRNENLDTAGTGRMPLLVAPLPPQEPAVASLVETTDDTLAVETDSVPRPASDSRVWLLLAAAAGAFGMLFVRRRPARY
jgi:hypothetical protein